jgi:hypothetical protein
MDPRDRPPPLPDGAACTACGAPVPTGRIRILARRDDLAFIELACDGCGSAALGLLVPAGSPDGAPVLDVAGDQPDTARTPAITTIRPISEADVDSVRADLAAWDGDLVGWLDAVERRDQGRPVMDR